MKGGIRIPGLASWLSDPADGTATVVEGLDIVPADERPTLSQVNTVHLAWDVMVGLGTLLFLLAVWYGLSWLFRRDMPRSKLFLGIASCAGVAAIVCMEAGWVVSEVGRQPWIVYNLMKVEDAATANTGVWIMFVLVTVLYIGLGITTILILRTMSKRFRDRDVADHEVPYGPSEPATHRGRSRSPRRRWHERARRRRALPRRHHLRRVRRRRLRCRLLGPRRRRRGTRRTAPGGDRPLHRTGVGSEPRLADLRVRRAVDRVLRGLRVDHPDPVRPPRPRRLRDRPAGIELRLPQDRLPHPRPPQLRRRLRRRVGASCPYCMGAIAGAIASGRVPAGGVAGEPWTSWVNPTSVLGGVLAVVVVAYLAAVYLVRDARRQGDERMAEYFRRRAIGAAIAAGLTALVGIFVLRADARYIFDGLTSRALPFVVLSAACGIGSLVLLLRDASSGARLLAIGAVVGIMVGWGVAQWPYILPTSLEVTDAAAPTGTLATLVVATVLLAIVVVPGFVLLYSLDQKGLLPEESVE